MLGSTPTPWGTTSPAPTARDRGHRHGHRHDSHRSSTLTRTALGVARRNIFWQGAEPPVTAAASFSGDIGSCMRFSVQRGVSLRANASPARALARRSTDENRSKNDSCCRRVLLHQVHAEDECLGTHRGQRKIRSDSRPVLALSNEHQLLYFHLEATNNLRWKPEASLFSIAHPAARSSDAPALLNKARGSSVFRL